jgi:hypothetical protein
MVEAIVRPSLLCCALTLLAPPLAGCGADADTGTPAGDGGEVVGGSHPSRIERYIRSDTHPRLVIEVDTVPGFEPYANTAPRIEGGLAGILDKPDGVELVLDGTIDSRGEDHTWTRGELRDLANDTFDLVVDEGTAKMHVMFVDGHDEHDSDEGRILGLAWDHRHIVIYKRTLQSLCSGIIPGLQQSLCENAEVSVLTHEVGHLLGLVDMGLPMVEDHKDEEHGPHSANEDCVMYWAYAGEQVVDVIGSRLMDDDDEALGFDQACLDDIAALRNAP